MAHAQQTKWLANCSALVQSPAEISPIRIPQAVHSAMLQHLANRSVVEIGTRDGDGLACFSHVASTVVAVELDPAYCPTLRKRAGDHWRLGDGNRKVTFEVRCGKYRTPDMVPDADVYTWWQQPPDTTDRKLLHFLREAQMQGVIRPTAMALVLSESSYPPDRMGWRWLQTVASWTEDAEFDEQASCEQRTEQRRRRKLCQRAKGSRAQNMNRVRKVHGRPRLAIACHIAISREVARGRSVAVTVLVYQPTEFTWNS